MDLSTILSDPHRFYLLGSYAAALFLLVMIWALTTRRLAILAEMHQVIQTKKQKTKEDKAKDEETQA